jgi:hypothetical protein
LNPTAVPTGPLLCGGSYISDLSPLDRSNFPCFSTNARHTNIMVLAKQRGRSKAVTSSRMPILIVAKPGESGGAATFALPMQPPLLVREFQDADLRRVLQDLPADEKIHFIGIVQLTRALQGNDRLVPVEAKKNLRKSLDLKREPGAVVMNSADDAARANLYRQLTQLLGLRLGEEARAKAIWDGRSLSPHEEKNARWLLSRQLSTELLGVQLVMWWTGWHFTPALFCPYEPTALYVRALLGFAGTTRGLAVCPHCGTFFIQDRTDQQYCTIAHREAHRVARWRARKKKNQ